MRAGHSCCGRAHRGALYICPPRMELRASLLLALRWGITCRALRTYGFRAGHSCCGRICFPAHVARHTALVACATQVLWQDALRKRL